MDNFIAGLIIGFLFTDACWLLTFIFRKTKKAKGCLTVDFSGEGNPVSLDISQFDTILTDKQVLLDVDVILPEPVKEEKDGKA